jgi:hypothetical protein
MPTPLKRAARYRANAIKSLANAEAAADEATRRTHLAITKHFYSLAEEEISCAQGKMPNAN